MIVFKAENENITTKTRRKLPVAIIALLTILVFATGFTLAYLFTSSNNVINEFVPAHVYCEVNDDYSIKNTSDIKAYIRVTGVTNFVNTHNNICGEAHEVVPTIVLTDDTKWVHNSDGYWYYTDPVDVGGDTSVLVTEFTSVTAADGCKAQLVVLCSAIQAEPFEDYEDAWETVAGVAFG